MLPRRFLFAFALVCISVTLAPQGAAADDTIESQLRAALRGKIASRAKIGYLAVDLESGRTVASHAANLKLNPASVSKLVTTTLALQTLGPAHRYVTVLATDSLQQGTAQNLYLRAEGDPSLGELELIGLALQLKRAGVNRLRGRLVVDRGAFDRTTLPPVFDQKKTEDWYRPTIDAFAVNQSYVTVIVDGRDRQVGKAPRVIVIPNCRYLRIENRATLRSTKKGEALSITSRADGQRTVITISGSLRSGRAVARRKRIYHAARFAASLLLRQLQLVGISGTPSLAFGTMPKKARVLARWKSPRLAALVERTNKTSSNFMAEMLLKSLGADDGKPASFATALERARSFLRERVKLASSFVFKNGSGLYDANRFSAAQIVALLRFVARDALLFPYFRNSLAVSGSDGTLRLRFRSAATKGRIFAKTGTLDGVSAIAGYLYGRRGRRIAFAVLINGPVVPYHKYREIHDRVVRIVAEQN